MKIERKNVRTLTLTTVGILVIAAIVAAGALNNKGKVVGTHARHNLCMTTVMMSRLSGAIGVGDWQQDYREETSVRESGDYVKRTTFPNGSIEIWAAENGEARQYRLGSKAPATSRPFRAINEFFDEKWLASHPNLRKENPLAEVLGYRTYVLRYVTGGGSYSDQYISPELGQNVMAFHYSIGSDGVMESVLLPVSIQVDKLDQELWNSIPREMPVVPAKKVNR